METKYFGYLVMATDQMDLSSTEVINIYRDKDGVEKVFDDTKNTQDQKRLGIHSHRTLNGKMFILFVHHNHTHKRSTAAYGELQGKRLYHGQYQKGTEQDHLFEGFIQSQEKAKGSVFRCHDEDKTDALLSSKDKRRRHCRWIDAHHNLELGI